MEILIAISLLAGIFTMTQPSTGTYAMIPQGSIIVRMDTRTGALEKCSLIGSSLDCQPVTQK